MLRKILKYALKLLASATILLYLLGGGIGSPNYKYAELSSYTFAHRGCCTATPQNSKSAFDQAVSKGLPIETDVRLTKDNKLVLHHDDALSPRVNKTGSVADYTSEELRKTPIIHNGDTTDEYILSLQEYLERYPKTITYLDVKTPTTQLANELVSLLNKETIHTLWVADASLIFLAYLKWKNPDIITIWEGFDAGKEWTYGLIPKNWKPNYLASLRENVTLEHINWLSDNNLLHTKIVYGAKSNASTDLSSIPLQLIECQ